jgi:putative tricarboxylic transport membrane protein
MHDSDAWKKVLVDQGWTDSFVTGADFGDYLKSESDRVQGVLGELGLT